MVLGNSLLSLPLLLKDLCAALKTQSKKEISIETDYTIPSIRLARRAKLLDKHKFLVITPGDTMITVMQTLVPYEEELYQVEMDLEDYENISALSSWHQRYEMKDMPDDGWVVDPLEKTCDCVMNLKDGVCVQELPSLMSLRRKKTDG